ncbi:MULTISPECIES: glutamyl-tRNA reductase [Cyanophyceae]|uniref:glutamyl-tRNA reductase n=1 Tax=Cyanophyceae TaxID=3028117 RepID=UPI0016863939|nr:MULTISPECIES: glutamyl-tRNA reductase [Cyanophyceae]MBD1917757.1 glutamyl-tRNA reductase [Phormidium sp. FACHB-77]MBD2032876.1 glutamyl-tRNA reductase [Phormidium sp. FACHB-322]MBD2051623.1 glutamyl-tRNA reductase [Leptolyngbya sp. FACHB-60]
MNIAVIGLSHKTAPVQIREKLSIPTAQTGDAIAHLTHCPHIDEVSILSTCNRLEIHIVTEETEQGIREVTQFLSEHSGLPLHELRQHLFILLHQDAVNHLMRVAAGLDSLVLGEGQILAQVKHAHQLAQQHKSIGRVLDRLLKQSLTAGKRVRSETSIGTGAVSISSAAVELARMKVPHLNGCHVSILGAGKMARLLVQHLISKDSCTITILNRTIDRANELAKQFPDANIRTGTLDTMLETVQACDVVFTCTSATEPLLHRENLEPLVASNRTLMLFDIAVPLNVHTNANELDNVHAFNVDDLKAVVAQNQASRRRMAMEAQVLLDQEVESFMDWWRSLDTVGTISSLRSKVETIREQELEKALSRLGSEFAEKHQEVIEALTRGIVNKILHDPMVQLRAQRDIEARKRAMQTLQVLFDLETASNEKYS